MKLKILLTSVLIIVLFANVFGQKSNITGTVISDQSGAAVPNAQVKLQATDFVTTTDSNGVFQFKNVPYKTYTVEIKTVSGEEFTAEVSANKAEVPVTVKVPVTETTATSDAIPEVSLSENELKETSDQNISGLLNASRDAFVTSATSTFGITRFQLRGYDSPNFVTYMNGAPMTDLSDGRTYYSIWGGLNNVTRNRETNLFTAPSTYSYGSLGGAYNINSTAVTQRKQLEVSYSIANRTYDNRVMVSYGTGLLKGGWSVSVSGSRRWSDEGYVKGTYYDGWSYFASVEKIFHNKHFLTLTAMGSPSKYGRSGPATMEMYNLASSHYYNPYWGFQDGKVRNASVADNNLPLGILTYEWRINPKSGLNAAFSYLSGKNKLSGLDWFNAPDPRPDYYRKLPSYFSDAPDVAAQITNLLSANEAERQIKWDDLYNANYISLDSVQNVDGVAGQTVIGHRSNYVLSDRITDTKKTALNVNYNNTISDRIQLSSGLTYQHQVQESYAQVKDLLGGDFYVDYNQYAEQDFPNNPDAIQNDLNNPNRILHVGDKYSYDYKAYMMQTSAWGQLQIKEDKIDGYFALQLTNTRFWRDGLVKSGVLSETSYGKSAEQHFFNYAIKAGATYKLDGRNFIYANASYLTRAPYFDNAFISARTRNDLAPDLKNETIYSVDGGYMLRAPRMKVRFTGYYTQFNDATKTTSFYHDDYRTFVNYTLTNIDVKNVGSEIAVEGQLGKGLSAYVVACMGKYLYTDRPTALATRDNSADVLASNETIYQKNFHDAGGPEDAYTLGLSYRSPKFWFVSLNFNYFANTWVQISPARRTASAVDLVPENSAQWNEIVDQEKLDPQFTMDFFGGYSWKVNNKWSSLKKQTFLVLNLGLTNLLNNKNLITGGFEQGRFDFVDHNPDKFANKYFYSYGTTFFASLALRFN